MGKKLHIEELKSRLGQGRHLSGGDIAAFYRQYEPELKQETVNWRIHTLVEKGVLKRIGKSKFETGQENIFVPEVTSSIKTLYQKIKQEFPYLLTCIWSTSILNEFMIHQPGRFYQLVEVEREAAESVFYTLKRAEYPVFMEPDTQILERYMPYEVNAIIVQSLITEAPLQETKGIKTPTLEKILVDIFCDPRIFAAQQGAEMRTIFTEALSKYTVNQDRLLRYADRRAKKKKLMQYLIPISKSIRYDQTRPNYPGMD